MPDVDLISLDGGFVVMTDSVVLPVTNWFDFEGNDCDRRSASWCVAGRDGYGWFTIDIFPQSTRLN